MRKYFLELFAIGLVDSEGRINTEHMTSDALMTAMKTMEELTQMKMDRLVLETTMEMILCMFESYNTRERVRESSLATNLVFSRVCEEFDNQI